MDLELVEHGAPTVADGLPRTTVAALRSIMTVTEAGPDRWILKPRGKVGVARIGDLTVRIQPKVTTNHLLFLIGYANKMVDWREPLAEVSESADLVATVADAYSRLAERALAGGILHAYRSVDAALPVMRGRLRVAAQLGARHGAALPLEVTYQHFGVDNPENRLLKAAARAALALPRLRVETDRRLRRITRRLADVSAPQLNSARSASRLSPAYQAALGLAELVLRGSSFALPRGPIRVEGFILDMHVVFQDFLCRALGEGLQGRIDGSWRSPYVGHLDEADSLSIRPDFAWMVDGRPVIIVDAKYKADGGNHVEDVYQMISYCSALGLPAAHLVYARGDVRVHEVRGSGIKISRHQLDLQQTPRQLLAAIEQLAENVTKESGLAGTSGGNA